MRLLLDTHALVWWWLEDVRLPPHAREAIRAFRNDVLVSAVAAWEVANKYRIGKWPEVGGVVANFPRLVADAGFHSLPIVAGHALLGGGLSGRHKDPFDRLIAAQALTHGLTMVTTEVRLWSW